jgi:hypothetical protein
MVAPGRSGRARGLTYPVCSLRTGQFDTFVSSPFYDLVPGAKYSLEDGNVFRLNSDRGEWNFSVLEKNLLRLASPASYMIIILSCQDIRCSRR